MSASSASSSDEEAMEELASGLGIGIVNANAEPAEAVEEVETELTTRTAADADRAAVFAIFGAAMQLYREELTSEGLDEEEINDRMKEIKEGLEQEGFKECTEANEEGRIVRLDLKEWNSESVPPEIGELQQLQQLNLQDCKDLETLPSEIGKLQHLQGLDLHGCSKLKSLPPEIGELQQLQHLNLKDCESMISLPPEIGELQCLRELDLQNCKTLKLLPPEIWELRQLRRLYLGFVQHELEDHERFMSLPSEIQQLGHLEILHLRNTKLQSLPREIGQLQQLRTLILIGCEELESLPSEIGKLQHLQELDLRDCSKLMLLPPEIGELQQLQHLNLKDCEELEILPSEIGQLQHLQELDLQGCSKLKSLPPEIGELQQLQLSLHDKVKVQQWPLTEVDRAAIAAIFREAAISEGCEEEDEIKEKVEEWVKGRTVINKEGRVVRLYLSNFSSMISLPPEIGQLQLLQVLSLRSCHMLETLPPEIMQLQLLQELNLPDCYRLESLPPEIWELQQLRRLCLGWVQHKLEDRKRFMSLPSEIQQLHQLEELNLMGNKKLRSLPHEIGELQQLRTLDLRECSDLNTLPLEIGMLEHLTELILDGCMSLKVPPPNFRSCEGIKTYLQKMHKLDTDPQQAFKNMEGDGDFRPLFLAAEHYPSLAPRFGQLVARDKTIADRKDDRGRTLLEMSCEECKREMRLARLFYRRYDMEDRPKYESKTCKVFFAMDYEDEEGGGKGTPVAMKFVEEKSHLDAELRARHYDDGHGGYGEPRFDKDYVVADLRHYDGSDEEFKQAADSRHLPPYCLVLEQGERNLYEAIASENLNDYRNRLRVISILYQLGGCLQHLHEEGYIHGDFKPKNAVRETHSRQWQLIDFDAAVKINEPMGHKVSTAYLPPEFVKLHNGIPILKGLCACTAVEAGEIPGVPRTEDQVISKDKVLLAAKSVDVWSFGIIAFSLLSDGKSLFSGMDPRENLSEKGLRELSRWSDSNLERKLKLVPDVAKDFLRQVLHPKPKERPNMDEILEHEFFSAESLYQKKHDLEMQLKGASKDTDKVLLEELKNQLKEAREDIKNRVKEEHEKTRKQAENAMSELNEKLCEISSDISELNEKLETYHKRTANMLVSLLQDKDTMPKFMCILPVNPKKGSKKLKHWCNPNNWVKEEVKVFFLCPITMENVGEGYTLTSLKGWVKKYGPALHTSLTVLRVACGVGRLAGLPIPNLNDVAEGLSEKLSGQTAFLSTLSETLEDAGLGFMTEATKAKWESFMEGEVADLPEEQKTVLVESYEEIAKVVDDDYERSGLVKATCPGDGSVEYVSPKVEKLFEKYGCKLIGKSESELRDEFGISTHEWCDRTEQQDEHVESKAQLQKKLEALRKENEELAKKIEEMQPRKHHIRRWKNWE